MGRARIQLRDLIDPVLLAAFFLLAVVLVPPRGEFPINDDWDYHATVADLLHHGEMRLSDWPAMPLVGQIYWGAGFAKLFGLYPRPRGSRESRASVARRLQGEIEVSLTDCQVVVGKIS